jgi:pimeloyl-ACP methyl ester carboxylesterase
VNDDVEPTREAGLSRRRVIAWVAGGVGVAMVAAVTGVDLVAHGVLPGQHLLDELDGACDAPSTHNVFAPLGPSESGTFASAARRRDVAYTVAYPSGHQRGDELALVVMLHGFGAGSKQRHAFSGMSPAQAASVLVDGAPVGPFAVATVDGGNGYWNPHPGDDPMAMVVDEFVPMLQRRGLGRASGSLGLMGTSMGGYGALAIAERNPGFASAVAAVSPAIFTSYHDAIAVNPGSFANERAFAAGDVITHASALAGVPVRVASGNADPFHDGVEAFARVAPPSTSVAFSTGCHDGRFFSSQMAPSLAFLGAQLR